MRQSNRVAEELNARGSCVRIEKNGNFLTDIYRSKIRMADAPDFVVYLDKDKYLPRMLEKKGVRLFNSARGVELCDDKMLTYIALAENGVAVPDTIPAPLCYYPDAAVREEYCREIGHRLGYPLVVKKSFGSWGMDVNLIENFSQLCTVAEQYKLFPHLYQKYVCGVRGQDTRILVVGGKAVATMRRRNEHDFRSNIGLGGKGYAVQAENSYLVAAERAARILQLDYCGVDVLDGENGEPVICEVNSNAFFNEAERVTGVNVAGAYAEYIVHTMNREE